MWRKVLITSVAVAGLSLAAAVNADAQRMGAGAQGGARMSTGAGGDRVAMSERTRTGFSARAQSRGPHFTPPGWSHGKKTGWHCRVGAAGCKPPGLRR